MDGLLDDPVALSAIFLGVALLAGLAVAGLAGFRLYRTLRRTQRILTERAATLSAEAERITSAVDRLPQRSAEITGSVELLRTRAQAVGVIARAAGEAAVVLRSPMRYLSG